MPASPVLLEVEVYTFLENVPIVETRQVLERIFESSSIQLGWTLKDPASPEGQTIVLTGNPKSSEQARNAGCAALRSISLRIATHAPPDGDPRELGFSLPFAPAGVNVVVYLDRVLATSAQTGVRLPILLAYAIAHEIGHVLLRTPNHTSRNLMSETWGQAELGAVRRKGLSFDRSQSAQMRNTLNGRSCSTDRRFK